MTTIAAPWPGPFKTTCRRTWRPADGHLCAQLAALSGVAGASEQRAEPAAGRVASSARVRPPASPPRRLLSRQPRPASSTRIGLVCAVGGASSDEQRDLRWPLAAPCQDLLRGGGGTPTTRPRPTTQPPIRLMPPRALRRVVLFLAEHVKRLSHAAFRKMGPPEPDLKTPDTLPCSFQAYAVYFSDICPSPARLSTP